MKLSTIKKRYPKTWNEFMKDKTFSNYELLHVIEIRHWFTEFIDYFDKIGIMLSVIHYDVDLDLSDLGKEYSGQWAYQISTPGDRLLCYRNEKTRKKADRKGLIECFKEREKQLYKLLNRKE